MFKWQSVALKLSSGPVCANPPVYVTSSTEHFILAGINLRNLFVYMFNTTKWLHSTFVSTFRWHLTSIYSYSHSYVQFRTRTHSDTTEIILFWFIWEGIELWASKWRNNAQSYSYLMPENVYDLRVKHPSFGCERTCESAMNLMFGNWLKICESDFFLLFKQYQQQQQQQQRPEQHQ